MTPFLTHSLARSIAEARWGRGGTQSYPVNRRHYYFACSGHGGFVIEKVDTDFAGLCIWARTTTGQAIWMDPVIRKIFNEAEPCA